MPTTTVRAGAAIAAASLAMTSSGAAGAFEYAYDDGVSNVTFGPPSSFAEFGDIDVLWGNYFFTGQATELVTSVDFGLGELTPGGDVRVWIFDDPDDDADPTNAVPVFDALAPGAADLGFDFNTLAIPEVPVSGGFFVAIGHVAALETDPGPGYPSPGRYDPDGRADRSWFFYDSDIPENDLGSSGFVTRMDGPFVPIPGAHAIRATTIPAPGGAAALALAGGAALGRRRNP